jgi:nucleotide-binding universal stress UspA family protein
LNNNNSIKEKEVDMFHKIIVAIDHSEMGKRVFDEAVFLAKATNACLMLLHVLSPYEEGHPDLGTLASVAYYPGMDDDIVKQYLKQWESYKKEGLEQLRSYTEEAIRLGVKAELIQLTGSPAYVICDQARTWGADLIIMGRRGLSGLKEAILGSISNYVTHHAYCSVLTVHGSVNIDTALSQKNSEALMP